MKEFKYKFVKAFYRLRHNNKEVINDYFRKAGMTIGNNCNICCNIMTPEPFLITLKDNVTIAGSVEFITHDNSISKVLSDATDLFGKIIIGNNCFIGARSTILYGVELADNIIVAAGSVVVSSFTESNIIIGGNPAKKISTWDSFGKKSEGYKWNLNKEIIDKKQSISQSDRLVKR